MHFSNYDMTPVRSVGRPFTLEREIASKRRNNAGSAPPSFRASVMSRLCQWMAALQSTRQTRRAALG